MGGRDVVVAVVVVGSLKIFLFSCLIDLLIRHKGREGGSKGGREGRKKGRCR